MRKKKKKTVDVNASNTMDEMRTVLIEDIEKCVYIGSSSVIGRRKEQQDAIKTDNNYAYLENGKIIAVLCDGMGGLNGGAMASALCSSIVYDAFHSGVEIDSIPLFYKSVIFLADDEVENMKDENGVPVTGSGTTLVSVVINGGELFWAGVGDSRIYIIRGNEILCITEDHNFLKLLNERVKRGEITQQQADSNPKKEALVSYIGMGGIKFIDTNNKPFQLLNGDHIVMCSDGLYRSLSEEEIKQVVIKNENATQVAADELTALAIGKNIRTQDNTSVVVISYQE